MDRRLTAIPNEARIYALLELSRRAGVSSEALGRWRISPAEDGGSLVVRPQPGASVQIRFPFSSLELKTTEVVRKSWYCGAPEGLKELIPEFIVPFCTRASVAEQPLFIQDGPRQFSCTEDLLASIVLTLSRYEELVSPVRDEHGRFPASASLAFRHGYLNRPIVDEYGLALQQVLEILIPAWRPLPRSFRVKLTHDIDQVGIPFSFRSTVGHLVKRKSLQSCVRDFLSFGTAVEPTYLKQVRDICQLSIERNLQSALYWKTSAPGPFDSGYDLAEPRIVDVLHWARDRGVEMGVHPGYDTHQDAVLLEQEVQRCRKVLQDEKIGGRQHYLRWCPETWGHWERCGLAYDSTVGFADHAGFRAGTCIPYLPWLWREKRCAEMLEIPLVVMDVTLVAAQYMGLDPSQIHEVVSGLVRRCKAVGGVFTLLWHNTSLLPPLSGHYRRILDSLCGAINYDWATDLEFLRHFSFTDSLNRCSSIANPRGLPIPLWSWVPTTRRMSVDSDPTIDPVED